jgi:hypothetical protein
MIPLAVLAEEFLCRLATLWPQAVLGSWHSQVLEVKSCFVAFNQAMSISWDSHRNLLVAMW